MKTPDTITVEGKVRYYLGKVEKDIWELAVKTVYADMHAKVMALPDEHHYGPVGKNRCIKRADVLALIEEQR